jgi:excisionase family DNA binding protein
VIVRLHFGLFDLLGLQLSPRIRDLDVSRPTVVRLINDNVLPAERIGNRHRLLLDDVLSYRDERRKRVIWLSLQRDFLLSLAIEGLYRPLWSSEILAELEYHETQKLINWGEQPDAAAVRARHLIDQMTTAFDDTLVENGNHTPAHLTCQTPTTNTWQQLAGPLRIRYAWC